MPVRVDQGGPDVLRRADRLPVPAAALATLLVIVVSFAATGGAGPDPSAGGDRHDLTPAARRVLDELPGAFTRAGLVVVPADLDPGVAWTGAVGAERVDGELVELGVHGLVGHGYLPSSGTPPAWAEGIGEADRVVSDTGPLAYACTRWPGARSCTGSLLARARGAHYIVRSGLDVPEDPQAVLRFQVLDLGEPAELTLGTLPPGATRVEVEDAHGRLVANVSETGVVAGATLWWLVSDAKPQVVYALDRDGGLVVRRELGG